MPSDTLILHQYSFSPFAEKIRSMLGFTDLSWQAVEVPPLRMCTAVLANGDLILDDSDPNSSELLDWPELT